MSDPPIDGLGRPDPPAEPGTAPSADSFETLTPSGPLAPFVPPVPAPSLPSSRRAPDPLAAPPVHLPGYALLGELGRGGMGVVYLACQLSLNRRVALKMILHGVYAGAAHLARFRQEAQAIARLAHPNIVQVHEVGQHEGCPFFSLEFCPGGNLEKKLAGTPQPPRESAALVGTLARAMHAAHEKGVVHRDLKPANVLLAEDATLKITDFGLAKLGLGVRPADEAGRTSLGAVLGTPSYMAPEQASGAPDVGPGADVYALGAILYECLTGRPPFRAATALDTIRQVVDDEPVAPRALQPKTPRDLETICLKCLHKNPHDRYASAAGLAEDLARFLAGEEVRARPVGPLRRAVKWARRRPAVAALVAAVVLVGAALLAGALGYRWQVKEAEVEARASALVASLSTAETARVPDLIEGLAPVRRRADPLLRQVLDESPRDSRERLHASLALLPVDAGQVPFLAGRLLRATPAELLVLRAALAAHATDLRTDLWRHALDPATAIGEGRLCAQGALAVFDADDPQWEKTAPAVVAGLVAENPALLGAWLEVFRPVRLRILGELRRASRARGRSAGERNLATAALADYAADQPALLVGLIAEADDFGYTLLWPRLRAHPEQAVLHLKRLLAQSADPGWEVGPLRPVVSDATRDALARRQANAAVALLRLGEAEAVWPLLRHERDPSARSYLIDRLAALGASPKALVARLGQESDASARAALLLSLGGFGPGRLPMEQALVGRLLKRYRTDPDPGTHGAIDWLLRQRLGQGEALDRVDREVAGRPPGPRRWYVGRQRQTFTVLPGPVEFRMGSPASEPDREPGERRHRKRIPRSFAIATRAVTVAEFQRFLRAHPEVRHDGPKKFSPEPDCPVASVTWYEAAAYCRWLSEQEGVPPEEMCYPPVAEIREGMKLPGDYLRRTGYRLPTEAEWECACRAGAETARFFGRTDELLGRYAWSLANARNHSWPVGRLKPNDLGLFDAHGNVWNWLQDRERPPREGDDVEDDVLEVGDKHPRLLGGGSFFVVPADVRCAYRFHFKPSSPFYSNGIRVARTAR